MRQQRPMITFALAVACALFAGGCGPIDDDLAGFELGLRLRPG